MGERKRGKSEREEERKREDKREGVEREREEEGEREHNTHMHTLTHTRTTFVNPYPANIAALFAITHSGELKPIIPTPWLSSRPSYKATWFSTNASL